jgi:BTB/POZ domain
VRCPVCCRIADNQRIRINVSGYYFETAVCVLDRHPSTLLGDRLRRRRFYDRARGEFFFDRHRPSFEAIFVYYQRGGRLRRPAHVPDDVFLDELTFYELEPAAVDEYRRLEGYTTDKKAWPSNAWLRQLWMLFECPETSRAAFLVAVWSVLMTRPLCWLTRPGSESGRIGSDDISGRF